MKKTTKDSKKKIALEVKNVSKSFRLPTEQANGIKQAFINYMRGIKGYKEQQVLKDISFKVEEGDFFGIVGRNGSGKSTLLKLISQIYVPDKGKVTVNGKLVPFIELGVGFNHELTGRENVYLNGALLGFSHDEMSSMYEDIVKFAELREFMDQKLKNYSSGMQVRLAFSIAIKTSADILVLDEVLAVGDAAFQRKCYEYFGKLKKANKTVILVTHDMEAVRQFCNKAILIEKGKIINSSDSVDEVADGYLKLFNPEKDKTKEKTPDDASWGTKEISLSKISHKINKDHLVVDVTLNSKIEVDDGFILAIRFHDADGTLLAGASTRTINQKSLAMKPGDKLRIRYNIPNNFGRRSIVVGYHLVNRDNTTVFDSTEQAFKVDNPSRPSYYPIVYDGVAKIRE